MPSKDEELAKGQPNEEAGNADKAQKPAAKPKAAAEAGEKSKKSAEAPATDAPKETTKKAEPVAASETSAGAVSGADAAAKPSMAAKMSSVLKPRQNMKSLVIKVAAVAIALVAVVVIVFGVLIYAYQSENPAVKAVAGVIPYPVEQVNGQFVTYSDYLFEVNANERAYQNNAKLNNQPATDFKSADGKKLVKQIKEHALDKLKSDALLAQLAHDKKVKVTDKEVNDLINQLYQRYGGKDTLLKTLNQIYGWNINDLKKVVRKQLLTKNLEDKVTSDPAVDKQSKAKAQDVLKKVKDGGDFAALAKQYSQSSDAASGGDLGFVTKGQLPTELEKAAEALQPGQVSDVIKTQYGYEIIKVQEKKDDGSIHVSQILIKTVDFNQYFEDQLKKAKTHTYIKIK